MSIKSLMDSSRNIELLKYYYLERRLSTTEISKTSKDVFGTHVTASTIYNALVRNHINVRSKSESVSMSKQTLNPGISYITESLLEWIDGFLLGDGYIDIGRKRKSRFCGSRFCFGSVEKDWTEYAMLGLKDYRPSNPKQVGKIRLKSPRLTWHSYSLTHPDIVDQAKRWYGQNESCKKDVPKDVRITPTSLLLWYLGDGSITNSYSATTLQFATCSFPRSSLEDILIPKMNEMGLKCRINNIKNDIVICAESIGLFFEIIGHKSPIKCYEYKFEYPQWLKLYRLSEIVNNNQEKWRAQYMYKSGKLNCSKSPGGRMLLFTEEEVLELKEKLNQKSHTQYSEKEEDKLDVLTKLSSLVNTYQERWNARYFMSHKLIECESGSKFTEGQAKILREKLNQYGEKDAIPSHIVDYHFRQARKNGFPYYQLTKEEFTKGVKTLKDCVIKKDNKGLYAWAGNGSELATYFHPHIFECKRKGKISAIELYESDIDFRRAIWKMVALYPKITPSKIREICRNEQASSRINQFPPRVMMAILRELYPNGGITLLDPTHGFSGRLIGSYASGLVSKYIGIDISSETHNGAVKTKEWLDALDVGAGKIDIELIRDDCLKVMDKYDGIDFIFTSPPFLDVERYVGVDFQTDYNQWLIDFIKPFCIKSLKCLKVGGQLGVYLEKIEGHNFREDFKKIALDIGFNERPSVLFKMSYGENTRDKSVVRGVPIMVFRKN